MSKIHIYSNRDWDTAEAGKLIRENPDVSFIQDELMLQTYMHTKSPEYIFFTFWSNKIPPEIYESFNCIGFHMADLPFGKGGSPLQNLIYRGIYETKVTAFKITDGLDSGPIYMKRPLSLHGSAEEIYLRCSQVIYEMIRTIISSPNMVPAPQLGKGCYFPRRQPQNSILPSVGTIQELYDHVRMLDAKGYPHSLIEWGDYQIEFTNANLRTDGIEARVWITKRS